MAIAEASMMDTLLQDVRFGMRAFAKAPGFTALALVTLAIGAGANATVFSFVDALLLRPARGVEHPSTLVAVYTSDFSSGPFGSSSYPDYLSLRQDASAFSSLAAYGGGGSAIVKVGDNVERIGALSVTPNFFDVVGLRPGHGRLFGAADAAADAPPVAVIGHALWERAYQSSPTAIGSIVSLAGAHYTIIGIAPPRFEGLDLGRRPEIWTMLRSAAADPAERGNRGLSIVGRLAEGSSLEQAQAQVSAIADRLGRTYPDTNLGTLDQPDRPRPMIVRRHTRIDPSFRNEVAMIGGITMIAALLVLLAACANVANLLLSRAMARAKDIAIRLALGAGRARLLRQLVIESLLLGAGGAAAGLLAALWTADALPSFFPAEQARMLDAGVDARVIAFSVLLSGAASLIFGLAPALQALHPSPLVALRENARVGDSRVGARLRRGFVVAQIALAFVLLVSAGLLVRSLLNAGGTDLGFETRNAVVASVELPRSDMTPDEGHAYYAEALDRLRALPAVEAVALTQAPPLSGRSRRRFRVDGYQPRQGEDMELPINIVSPGYFETLRMPMLAGRDFDSRDTEDSARVVIVNEVVSSRFFGGQAVGKRISNPPRTVYEIVGVVRAGVYRSVQEPPAPIVYYPLAQSFSPRMTFLARTAIDASSRLEEVRRELRRVHPGVAVFRTVTLEDHLGEAVAGERLTASLVSVCGLLALALAMVGVYGVVAYSVVRRTREIGVRVALGARPPDIVRLVLSEGLGLTLVGTAAGIGMALLATRLLESMLYLVSPTDPWTFAAVPVFLVTTAVLAAVLPAWRAVRLDPAAVLRRE
jgi:predicted permease